MFGWLSSDLDRRSKQAVKRIFAQTTAQSPEAALVSNSRRVEHRGGRGPPVTFRANVGFMVELIPFASDLAVQTNLRRTCARNSVFRDGDPATVTCDRNRARFNAHGCSTQGS